MATILGTGDNSGSDTLTITLTANQPAGTVVHVVHAAALQNLTFFNHPSVSALPSDSRSGSWEDANFAGTNDPIIGSDSQNNSAASGSRAGIQLGQTGIRVSGSSLQSGDTVTVSWTDNGEGAAHMLIIGIVIAFSEFNSTAVTQYLGGTTPGDFVGVYYANGCGSSDQFPFDGKTISWSASGFSLPYPSKACTMFAASATYPAVTGWSPSAGSKVAEHQSSDSKLALAIHKASAASLTAIEPGGAWSATAQAIANNYQFAEGTSVGLRSWQRF